MMYFGILVLFLLFFFVLLWRLCSQSSPLLGLKKLTAICGSLMAMRIVVGCFDASYVIWLFMF
jgi:hypothetical protein